MLKVTNLSSTENRITYLLDIKTFIAYIWSINMYRINSSAMKQTSVLILMFALFLSSGFLGYSQVDIKGAGTTGSTSTFITKNNNSDTSLFVRDDGRVGIGTTTPSVKLEVNGMIYSRTGGFKCPDGTVITTAPTKYAKVYTVALSGGDYTSISSALGACAGANKYNPYLVQVMPGIYNEANIVCLKYVDLRGSGKYSCVITGTVTGADSCTIENFSIRNGIVCNGTSPFILHNIITRVDGPMALGIDVSNQGCPWIKENEILDCNGYGILCNGFGSDPWIIANKILRNGGGGIRCQNSSPTISNNIIDHNKNYGIYIAGAEGTPSEPTVDDNVIGHTTNMESTGIGISISFFAEPRVIANDIYLNDCGIEIDPNAQPSILSNDINYNITAGIRCYSAGANKNVVIMGNHIHSNTGMTGINSAGIFISNCDPMVTHNNIAQNRRAGGTFPDIDYSSCVGMWPMISWNVYDNINRSATSATGNYNLTSGGIVIAP